MKRDPLACLSGTRTSPLGVRILPCPPVLAVVSCDYFVITAGCLVQCATAIWHYSRPATKQLLLTCFVPFRFGLFRASLISEWCNVFLRDGYAGVEIVAPVNRLACRCVLRMLFGAYDQAMWISGRNGVDVHTIFLFTK